MQDFTRYAVYYAPQPGIFADRAAAWLGWLFDGLDMHLYTLVATPFVAELLHVNRSTVCRWRQTGGGPPVTWLGPRMPRYQRRHVTAWIERASR